MILGHWDVPLGYDLGIKASTPKGMTMVKLGLRGVEIKGQFYVPLKSLWYSHISGMGNDKQKPAYPVYP